MACETLYRVKSVLATVHARLQVLGCSSLLIYICYMGCCLCQNSSFAGILKGLGIIVDICINHSV